MVVGLLQFELLIHDAESLKDKRRVVRSVKDRLHRGHLCAVAEIARHDAHEVAVLGLAVVGTDGRRVGEVLDGITNELRRCREAELGDVSRQVLHGSVPAAADAEEDSGAGGDDDAGDLAQRAIDALREARP